MCGLIGYAGARSARPILLAGLERLEYRGYDSAGVALVEGAELSLVRSVGNLARLRSLAVGGSTARSGIGHTRRATHGRPSLDNAHPFVSCDGRLAVVLNGIVENYERLRTRLAAAGHRFRSQTDAEVVVHLLETQAGAGLPEAVRRTAAELEGHYAFAVLSLDDRDTIVATSRRCPLIVGLGEGEAFVASDAAAFASEACSAVILEDRDIVLVSPAGAEIRDGYGQLVARDGVPIDLERDLGDRGDHPTFMHKEICEQPAALRATISRGAADLDGLDDALRTARRVLVTGCGTAFHAGLAGRHLLEQWAGLPTQVEIASELRYRTPLLEDGTLVVAVSQSGETADTVAAIDMLRGHAAAMLAICNVPGTLLTRVVDRTLYTRAGREVGVAATKTFTAQVTAFALLALHLARLRGSLPAERVDELQRELELLPELVERIVAADSRVWQVTERLADAFGDRPLFFFLGRDAGLPVALEGALKLKEITYIAAEACGAGELKHGPIALIGEGTPVVAVMTDSHVFDKVVSNVEEARARGAEVIALTDDVRLCEVVMHADWVLAVPSAPPALAPIVAVVPLQILAHQIAEANGHPVDQPRKLAGTVTAE